MPPSVSLLGRNSKLTGYYSQAKSEPVGDFVRLRPDPEAVWERIQEAFGRQKPPEIARRLGLEKQAVYKWRDGTVPGLDTLIKICESTGVSLHWLLFGQGSKVISASVLPEGEASIYFGEMEHQIISDLAKESGRAFDEEVRELVLAQLKSLGLVIDQVEGVTLSFFGNYVPKLKPMRLWGVVEAGKPLEVFEQFETVLVPEEFFVQGRENFALRVRGSSMEDDGIFDGDIIICYESPTANNGETVVALVDGSQATVKRFYREKNQIRLQPKSARHKPIFLSPERVKIQGIVTGLFRRA